MSDQEREKNARSTEDLLSDFGAAPKKAPPREEPVAPAFKPEPTPVAPIVEPEPTPAPAPQKKASTAPRAKSTSTSATKGKKKRSAKKQTVKATTAEKKPEKSAKGKADAKSSHKEQPSLPSTHMAHRIIPYVLMIVAIYVGLSLVLNLFCNMDNRLSSSPSDHYMGLLGYYICEGVFGVFGPAAFVLPLLLVNLAIFWKRFADNRVLISKIISSLIFLIALGTVIHAVCLENLDVQDRINYSAADLYRFGAEMTGGGVIGGKLGYLCYFSMRMLGSVIVGAFILLVTLFYTLGTTPERLRQHFRDVRHAKKARRQTLDEENAETARHAAAANEKIRRVTGRSTQPTDAENDLTGGAVEIVEPARVKKPREDRMAPMPVPQLDPGTDTRPFIPSDVNRKLHEEQRQADVAAREAEIAEAAKNAPPKQPQPKLNPAKNRDAAVDPIFPKTGEFKQARRVPKEDRNFDLRRVFVDLEDDEPAKPIRKHAPVPPEVPLHTSPAPAAKPSSPVAPATKPVSTPVKPVAAPAKTVPAAKASAPIIKAAEVTHTDYGLSAEEFEKREAGQAPLPQKQKTATAKPVEKPAVKSEEKKAEPPKKYVFPPISYLRAGEPMTAENRAEIEANSTQLTNTLANFRVGVEEVNYSYGPTVTRYELVLSPGVRVRSVLNLADDIALALRSSGGVRIEAPIPGTNAVGIEVPNKTRSTIYLRDLIESKEFTEASGKLSACLGAGIAGESLIFDIAKMPHLLIAGTTGSGKSVCINCIIVSLLYRVRPDEVKLVLIDPKKVEFSIYKNIPHLMAPVVTTPKDAAGALQAAVEEMERRFELFESVGVRDLKGYAAATANDPDMPKIPHMVIIIDELADLMMTAKNEVETAICRIAQKARAAGMHLIIGTQRPSADVVTGLIKANVPSCIAFAVKSQIDSRVILDHGGAEALTGRGDMLFVPIGSMRDTRVQGAFVDDKEVERICEFLRATNGTAQYDERFNAKLKELAAQCGKSAKSSDDVPVMPDGEKGDDPKYADAVRVAVEEKRISTSLLQRKLEVGYGRAAKLIDRMQAEGIVSPPDGSKPRTILISNEEYIERFMMSDGDENA